VDVIWALLRGLAIGLAIAAAIGPISLLCIRRTLVDGAAVGVASGLGAATADGLYASIAAFGLTPRHPTCWWGPGDRWVSLAAVFSLPWRSIRS
jgi:hypothetical protein